MPVSPTAPPTALPTGPISGTKAEFLASLLVRVGGGDRSSFATLYRQTAPHLYGLALRITRNPAQAEDVVQDTFVAIWKNARRYDPAHGLPLAWMGMIVRNRALDIVTTHGRVDALPDDLAERLADQGPSAFARLAARREAARLTACLGGLPEEQRRAILSAFYDGDTHDAVAAGMQAPLGTVKSCIRRALLKLQTCLGLDSTDFGGANG